MGFEKFPVGGTIAKTGLGLEIWVDGQHIDEPHPIDLLLLVQSLHESGWFEIFTCGCGVGGCAGIVDGIQVTHSGPSAGPKAQPIFWAPR
jgi:hypothetical protein